MAQKKGAFVSHLAEADAHGTEGAGIQAALWHLGLKDRAPWVHSEKNSQFVWVTFPCVLVPSLSWRFVVTFVSYERNTQREGKDRFSFAHTNVHGLRALVDHDGVSREAGVDDLKRAVVIHRDGPIVREISRARLVGL
jgi:hypothetical protein